MRSGALDDLVAKFESLGVKDPEVLKIFEERKQYLKDFLDGKFERNLGDEFESEAMKDLENIMGSGSSTKKGPTTKKGGTSKTAEDAKKIAEELAAAEEAMRTL